MSIETIVLPVAGLGTRFLPATKAIPKEMVPILNKPVIQYALEEAAQAGIKHAVFVSSPAKAALEDHFDENIELETLLAQKNKLTLLDAIKTTLPSGMRVTFVRQGKPLGLGHAIAAARHVVGEKPFAVALPDDFILSPGKSCLADMVAIYRDKKCYSIAVEEVALEETSKYGVVTLVDTTLGGKRIAGVVEKPSPENAPSRFAVVGRYILPASIWRALEQIVPGVGGELQLTDAIELVLENKCFLSHHFTGRRFDCGSQLGFIKANIAMAMHDPTLGGEVRRFAVAELSMGESVQPQMANRSRLS